MKHTALFLSLYFCCIHNISAQRKKINWHCPAILYYKDHWKRNQTNGLYYLDTPVSAYLTYKAPAKEKCEDKWEVGLNQKQIVKIFGKPTKIEKRTATSYALIYSFDKTLNKTAADVYQAAIVFHTKDNLCSAIFLEANFPYPPQSTVPVK